MRENILQSTSPSHVISICSSENKVAGRVNELRGIRPVNLRKVPDGGGGIGQRIMGLLVFYLSLTDEAMPVIIGESKRSIDMKALTSPPAWCCKRSVN